MKKKILTNIEYLYLFDKMPENIYLKKKASKSELTLFIVPEYNEDSIGFVSMDLLNYYLDLEKMNAAYIHDVYIRPKYKDIDITSTLLNKAYKEARNYGRDKVLVPFKLEEFKTIDELVKYREYYSHRGFKERVYKDMLFLEKAI